MRCSKLPIVAEMLPRDSPSGARVTTLITPADAFLPNSVLCGPRSTSTRSKLGKSPICAAERDR